MIIFKEYGRLGNQLFQYLAFRSISQDRETIILLGFESLQAVFDGIEAEIINKYSPKPKRYFFYRFHEIAEKLASARVFSKIEESDKYEKATVNPGLLRNIRFADNLYCQGESFFDLEIVQSLKIKSSLLTCSKKMIQEVAGEKTPVFVHIRRGDYVRWPSREHPAILSARYYIECMDIIRSKIPNPFFIFTSDDPFYVQDCFCDVQDSYISTHSDIEDFALMSLCEGGILSASSFSWWASYFAQAHSQSKLFLAPKFWAGHRLGQWYPQFIQANFLSYVNP
jgi:hypothetical protein